MVVNQDAGSLLAGDQILSVGGKSPAELIQMLWEVTPSENEYGVRYSAPFLWVLTERSGYLGRVIADGQG